MESYSMIKIDDGWVVHRVNSKMIHNQVWRASEKALWNEISKGEIRLFIKGIEFKPLCMDFPCGDQAIDMTYLGSDGRILLIESKTDKSKPKPQEIVNECCHHIWKYRDRTIADLKEYLDDHPGKSIKESEVLLNDWIDDNNYNDNTRILDLLHEKKIHPGIIVYGDPKKQLIEANLAPIIIIGFTFSQDKKMLKIITDDHFFFYNSVNLILNTLEEKYNIYQKGLDYKNNARIDSNRTKKKDLYKFLGKTTSIQKFLDKLLQNDIFKQRKNSASVSLCIPDTMKRLKSCMCFYPKEKYVIIGGNLIDNASEFGISTIDMEKYVNDIMNIIPTKYVMERKSREICVKLSSIDNHTIDSICDKIIKRTKLLKEKYTSKLRK